MKKRSVIIVVILLCVLALFGCGSKNETSFYPDRQPSFDSDYSITSAERKVVYNVDLEYAVEDINKAFDEIKAKLNVDEWSEFENISESYASLRLRIASARLDDFIASLSSVGTRTRYNKTAFDITGSYEDTNAKIQSLQSTLEKLEALKKEAANNIDELIRIENYISQTESELKEYQKQLSSYNSQIDYSYVNIYLSEEKTIQNKSFGSEIGNAFKNGWNGFITFVKYIFIGLCYIFVFFSIPAVIVGIILITVFTVRKKRRNAVNKKDETPKT